MGEVYILPRLLISRREFHTHLDCSAIFPIIPVIQQGQLLECSIFPAMELAQYQDYSYARLPGNQSIRLFIIQPALMEHPEQIHCSIDTFDLDEQPSCHALLYTWGNTIEAKDGPTGGYSKAEIAPFGSTRNSFKLPRIFIMSWFRSALLTTAIGGWI